MRNEKMDAVDINWRCVGGTYGGVVKKKPAGHQIFLCGPEERPRPGVYLDLPTSKKRGNLSADDPSPESSTKKS